jgi:hypothetical protein
MLTILENLASGLTQRIDLHESHEFIAYGWGGGGHRDLICDFSVAQMYLWL